MKIISIQAANSADEQMYKNAFMNWKLKYILGQMQKKSNFWGAGVVMLISSASGKNVKNNI